MRGVSLIEVIGGSFVETVDKKSSKVSTKIESVDRRKIFVVSYI